MMTAKPYMVILSGWTAILGKDAGGLAASTLIVPGLARRTYRGCARLVIDVIRTESDQDPLSPRLQLAFL